MKDNKRIDPLTGEEFIPKKISQKFANSANRIKYNNQKASTLRLQRAVIDKPLHKNHIILKELLQSNKEIIVHQEFLKGKGYNYTVFTHFEEVEERKLPCVYEFIVMLLENKQIKIIKK